jgi:hypothetical protein
MSCTKVAAATSALSSSLANSQILAPAMERVLAGEYPASGVSHHSSEKFAWALTADTAWTKTVVECR